LFILPVADSNWGQIESKVNSRKHIGHHLISVTCELMDVKFRLVYILVCGRNNLN
jgi:hypothetical protein